MTTDRATIAALMLPSCMGRLLAIARSDSEASMARLRAEAAREAVKEADALIEELKATKKE